MTVIVQVRPIFALPKPRPAPSMTYSAQQSTRFIRLGALIAATCLLASCSSLNPSRPVSHSPNPAALANSPVSARSLMETLSSWDGKGLIYPQGTAKVTALEVTVAPGGETGWHRHPVPSFGYLLEGELEVRLRNGTIRRFGPGQAIAEVVDTEHNGRNPGTVPTRLVVFYIGTIDRPLTVTTP
jgi:quercetin dioxygenase-like cupin family protein